MQQVIPIVVVNITRTNVILGIMLFLVCYELKARGDIPEACWGP